MVRLKAGALLTALLAASILSFAPAGAQQSNGKVPRAYPGAPPLIPHEVEPRKGLCLTCHETGVAGAPIVPHPTRDPVCVQCHVGQDRTAKPFVSGSKPLK